MSVNTKASELQRALQCFHVACFLLTFTTCMTCHICSSSHCVKVLWIYKLRNIVLSYRHFWPLNFELGISLFCATTPSCLNLRITILEAPWRIVIYPTCRIIQKTSMNCKTHFKLSLADISVTLVTNDTWYQCKQNILQQSLAVDTLMYILKGTEGGNQQFSNIFFFCKV